MEKQNLLLFNISTDSKNTSLGFAISWINNFSGFYDKVDIVTLHKGDVSNLNKNVNVHSEEFNNSNRIIRFIKIRRIIKDLINKNSYEFCLSHMSSALVLVAFTIPKFRSTQTIFWYTHRGPESLSKKIILTLATNLSNKIITASQNSFPIKTNKVTPIGHAIDYDSFYKKQISTKSKDFIIISRISRSKNIELSIQGFLNSCYGKTNELRIIGGTITDDDILYQSFLKDKYKNYSNIKFLGVIPHAELSERIKDVGFHINNTTKGFYDKSVLETMASGIINFYNNSDYDRNVHPKYIEHLKFNSTESDLSKKINLVSNFGNDELLDLIKFSQKRVSEESLSNLHERILKVI